MRDEKPWPWYIQAIAVFVVVSALCYWLSGCATTETHEHLAARHACEVEALGANSSIYLQARLYKDCMRLKGEKP